MLTAWRTERQKTSLNIGRKPADLREVMNAILYVNRTGIAWRYLLHDFPAHTTVFSYFTTWTADGTTEQLGVRLHRLVRDPEPTACVIDSQSVKTPTQCPSTPRTSTQQEDRGPQTQHHRRHTRPATPGHGHRRARRRLMTMLIDHLIIASALSVRVS